MISCWTSDTEIEPKETAVGNQDQFMQFYLRQKIKNSWLLNSNVQRNTYGNRNEEL